MQYNYAYQIRKNIEINLFMQPNDFCFCVLISIGLYNNPKLYFKRWYIGKIKLSTQNYNNEVAVGCDNTLLTDMKKKMVVAWVESSHI